jgi:hypothetical protein
MPSWNGNAVLQTLLHAVLGAAIMAGSAYATGSPIDPHLIVGGAVATIVPLFSTSPYTLPPTVSPPLPPPAPSAPSAPRPQVVK